MNVENTWQIHNGLLRNCKMACSLSCVHVHKDTIKFQGLQKGPNQSSQTQESRNAVLGRRDEITQSRRHLTAHTQPPPTPHGESCRFPTPTMGDGDTGWAMHSAHLLVSCLTSRDTEEKGRMVAGPCLAQGYNSSCPEGQVGTKLAAG